MTARESTLEHQAYKSTMLNGPSISTSHSGSRVVTGVAFFLLNLAVSVPGYDPVVPDLEMAWWCLQLYNISTSGFYSYCPAPDVEW